MRYGHMTRPTCIQIDEAVMSGVGEGRGKTSQGNKQNVPKRTRMRRGREREEGLRDLIT